MHDFVRIALCKFKLKQFCFTELYYFTVRRTPVDGHVDHNMHVVGPQSLLGESLGPVYTID